ncbi:hypothetical protein RB598_007118 [Gaeumannomyces tritici]
MRLRRAARVILVGAPGVGKGTQSERLLQRFPELSSISSGDLLRNNVKSRTPLGIKVESTMKAGGLVSDDLILRLISNEFNKRGWLFADGGRQASILTLASASASAAAAAAPTPAVDDVFMSAPAGLSSNPPPRLSDDPVASFILDGFPRTAAQAARLDHVVPVNLVVSLRTPLDVIVRRIAGRMVHEPSGRVYNDDFNAPRVPGRDDVTGEELVRRPDDCPDVYRSRFQKFRETSEPLLEHYARKGVLWEVEGLSSDDITPRLFREFEKRFLQ